MSDAPITLDEIAALKKRINEVAFAPLEEHGKKFDEINQELATALSSVEGISNLLSPHIAGRNFKEGAACNAHST